MAVVVKELFASRRTLKVVIERRADGNFQIRVCQLTTDADDDGGYQSEPFWSDVTVGKTLVDTLEKAEKLATEELARYA